MKVHAIKSYNYVSRNDNSPKPNPAPVSYVDKPNFGNLSKIISPKTTLLACLMALGLIVLSCTTKQQKAVEPAGNPVELNDAEAGNNAAIQKTKNHLETVKYNVLTGLEYKLNHPSQFENKADIQAQIDRINDVYAKVDSTYNSDGSVKFTFKGNVNVEDFKTAFGIQDGALRGYLIARHEKGLKDGSVYPVVLIDGQGNSTDINQYAERDSYDPETGMIDDFRITEDAKIKYSDGLEQTNTKTRRGAEIRGDYTQMSLGPNDSDKFTLKFNLVD